ncbi:MAG TPA: MG2 domain-containing protein [Pyrinomonadaceae bacterium]
MKKIATLIILILSGTAFGQQPDYVRLKTEAEKFYAEKSYSKAHELYVKAGAMKLPPVEARWTSFRLADTLWRAEAATDTDDSTKFEEARTRLEALVRDIKREDEKDRVWAEVQESLGDFWWLRRDAQDWSTAWPYYEQALDWWAGQRELNPARARYLQIVWKTSSPAWADQDYYPGYYGNTLPAEVLENAVRIALDQNDQAHAHYLLAMRLRLDGAWEQKQRVPEEFEGALKAGRESDWYDDALYYYAEWLASNGRVTQLDTGEWQQQPDYVRALELFRRLLSTYKKAETRYYDNAQQQVENITKPTLGVYVSNIFLPDSEIQLNLSWRNVERLDFALYKVELPRDVRFTDKDQTSSGWVAQVRLAGREPLKAWSKQTTDDGLHKPGQEALRLDQRLPAGAYLIEARSGNTIARDVILITDASLVLKTAGKQALVYFCNAISGAPLASASVKLWEKSYHTGTQQWVWRESEKTTNADGLALFELVNNNNYEELFVSAGSGARQAFSPGQSYNTAPSDQPWRIYAFTDRPAYRPQETVQWKFIARKTGESVYTTPANQTIEYEIKDPRGNKVKDDRVTLNTFGSAWGTLELTEAMPLGAYEVTFYDAGRHQTIGSANLFRLEEYKLPEFKVGVRTPETDGHKRAFRLGEKVEVTINADYYFGGPVSGANVEVVVYQNPFYHYWTQPREYAWYYTDLSPQRSQYGGGRGQVIKKETLKTDATGKAHLIFETPRGAGQDWEYFIEARVTDASRREVLGSDTVRVTRQRYYVYPRAAHNIYRPADEVQVNLKSLDANEQPMEVAGQVKVTRDYYYEIWQDPAGREVKGEELKRLRAQSSERGRPFPPAPGKDGKPWVLKFSGYQHEEILTESLKTDAEGEALLKFTPAREGYYRIAWTSPDKGGPMIQAETAVWVTNDSVTELGYRQGGLEIIVDRDTFRAGERAPVIINTLVPDRYVLFSIEGDGLYNYQLVHLTGTSRLIEIPVEEKYVPNIFLGALMVSESQLFMDTKQVVVPPVNHFLNVEVKADREQYQPREEGTLTITTRDREGQPVAAEVALGLVDSSVFYIQQETAGDPRQFYFGTKRTQRTQTQSTFQQKAYARLVWGPDKQLIDERVLEQQRLYAAAGGAPSNQPYERLQVLGGLARRERGAQGAAGQLADADNAAVISREAKDTAEYSVKSLPANGRRVDSLSTIAPIVNEAVAISPEPAVQVRNDFRSTVFWQPDVITDRNGLATIKVKYPDSLTNWTATARVSTEGDKFGVASTETRTKQPLIVRLQAPRFFVVGDTATVSAVINNNNEQAMMATASLDVDGVVLMGVVLDGRTVKAEPQPVNVPAGGEARVDWTIAVRQPGAVKLKVAARAQTQADAMERDFMAYEHGIEKFVAKSGKLRGNEVAVNLDIPAERKRESTRLTVQVAPSMAVTMLDALPYLIDYPYGCTEQTMSRFLPAVITAKTLKEMGLSPEAAMSKVFGGIEPATAAEVNPKGKRDLKELERITRQSLDRLYGMQHEDGGWGWWKEDDSDHFMTAYVLWGLTLALEAGIEVRPEAMQQAAEYLDGELAEEEDNQDMQAWMLHASAIYLASTNRRSADAGEASEAQAKALENLWTRREKLNAYTRALLALSAHYYGDQAKAQTLVRNLENGVKIDRTPDTSIVQRVGQQSDASVISTAHWGEDGLYYRWSEGGVEATSFVLRALLAIDPRNKLIEPVTNWLVKNRRGAQWSNTRDTAITVLALNDYLRQTGEAKAELEYELLVNGHSIVNKRLTAEDALSAPSRFVIDPAFIRDGANEIRIRRKAGNSPLYFSAESQFFSLEEPIRAAGHEIFVRREYYKLVSHPTLLKGYVNERVPLRDGEVVQSGERVEVVVTIEAKNSYEYLLFEDLKPAGLESVELRSGEPLSARELKSGALERKLSASNAGGPRESKLAHAAKQDEDGEEDEASDYTGRDSFVYRELRDRKVALFISQLPQGFWEIRYELRAEAPGAFHALPMLGHAMYVPEIRCNDAELRIRVSDKKG